MRGGLEYPASSASVGTPEPRPAGQLPGGKLERRTMATPSGRSRYFTCRVAAERADEMVADLQAYLRLFCRRRALIEVGDDKLAVHFEVAVDAAIFSGLWTVWAAARLVPTSRCLHRDELDRLRPNGMGETRRCRFERKSC